MNIYIAITIETDGRYLSYVISAGKHDNLLSVLKIKDIHTANICSTKKKAKELCNIWNDCYKNNGTYLYEV